MADKAGQTVLTGGGTRAKVGQKIIPKGKALKINRKGQVIPRRVREKLTVAPLNKVEFVEEKGRMYLVIKALATGKPRVRPVPQPG